MKYECGETLGDLEPVYDLFSITSEFGLAEAMTLCEDFGETWVGCGGS